MTFQVALTLIIFIATLLALATRRLRPDLTALCALLALVLSGILQPDDAFAAFGQPVIIIIPSVYVLGAALYETGVATLIANRLLRVSNRGPAVLVLVIMVAAGLMSGVLSSMLVVVVFMPAVLRLARQTRVAPAQLLLPLVAGATMGNLLTLVGTVSNLVVSDLLAVASGDPLDFFSLTPYGLASLALAVLWYLFAGRKLLRRDLPPDPQRPSLDQVEKVYRLAEQLYRLRVRSISDLLGWRLEETDLGTGFGLNVLAVRRGRDALELATSTWVLERDDVLVVEGARGDILQAASLHGLEPKGAMSLEEFNELEEETLRLAELMVPFRSQLVGRTLAEIGFRERYGFNVLAVHRGGGALRQDLPQLALAPGDTLLVQGPSAYLRQVGPDLNLVLATQLGPQPGDLITRKARWTLGILAVMVVCVASGLLSLATASLAAAVILVLTGCISPDRAYRSINGSVIVLIGGMLPLALALEKTGAAQLVAGQLANLSPAIGPLGTLMLLYLFTVIITQVISNSAAAALVTPIAVNLAIAQGLSPQLFAMAMAVAVSTSYLTPLSNTDNLLIRQAGRYTMRDYLVNGLPIFLLQAAGLGLLLAANL
jgi:di/tricarboxylate transporter